MLRRALGDPSLITSRDGGYALAVEPSEVDALAAMGKAAAASRLLDAGDDRGAADLCARRWRCTAGRCFRLPAMGIGSIRTEPGSRRPALKLLEIGFSARLRLGDVGNVIGELEAAVATYPVPGEPLGAADHRAVPSRAPGRCLGGVPAGSEPAGRRAGSRPWTATAAARAIDPDSGRVAGPPGQRGGTAESDLPMGNLPSMSADLVGRETEVAALSDLLATERLVEIVGPGGIGKTAVAIAVGRRLIESNGSGTGGVWLARLETATTADDVVDTLIAALNVPGGEPALFERLKATAALVILDNCEHVLDAAAALAVRLLDAAPALRILCTSQVPLDVDGEAVVRARTSSAFRRRRAVHPSSHCTTADVTRRARMSTPSSTSAAHSTVCRWRSNSPRHGPRRCRSRRSPGASRTASRC